jgi:hypothetical protein
MVKGNKHQINQVETWTTFIYKEILEIRSSSKSIRFDENKIGWGIGQQEDLQSYVRSNEG